MSPPLSPSPLQGPGPNAVASLSFLHVSSLQSWLYRRFTASFQLDFSENFSARRYIFDVFMGRGEFCVLFLCHLDLSLHFHSLIQVDNCLPALQGCGKDKTL